MDSGGNDILGGSRARPKVSPSASEMESAVLRGREHTQPSGIAAIAQGRAAIGLSVGGARKLYAHRDPNEDAAAFHGGAGGTLVAVADGHGGWTASELAIERLVQHYAPGWTEASCPGLRERWTSLALDALVALNAAILGVAAHGGDGSPRTTLALAVVRPGDDLVGFASAGDSHIFHVGEGEVVDLACDPDRGPVYLGAPAEDEEALRAQCVAGTERLAGTRALVLATDGLSEPGIGVDVPEAAVAEAAARAEQAEPALRPLTAARALVEQALEAQRRQRAGDNVASAVLWIA